MSIPAKLTLGAAVAVSVGIVGYVHFQQQYDRYFLFCVLYNFNNKFFIITFLYLRSKLHEGVIRDVERQKVRKMENAYVLQQQIDLAKKLKNDLQQQELSAIDGN